MKQSRDEKVFGVFNAILLFAVALVMLLPMWHVAMYSLSHSSKAVGGGLYFLPRGFSLMAYRVVLRDALIGRAYLNTIFVTVVGTALNLLMTFLAAYPLTQQDLRGRKLIQYMIFFTMLFSGGMIPMYLLVKELGMIDSLWALIIPGAISTYNVFVMRNFIQSLPESLSESARIDGANEFTILWRIIVPLSKPAMAVLGLMYGVAHWNSWFNCIIYISTTDKYTLQPVLRQILFSLGATNYFGYDPQVTETAMPAIVSMSVVIVATLPILCVYPFLQKYFIKGVMLGAVKG